LASALVLAHGKEHRVECETTGGNFVIKLHDQWSPKGVKRFLALVDDMFFTDQLLYKVVPGTLIQFGVAAQPSQMQKWDKDTKPLKDEPKRVKWEHGSVGFTARGTNSRTTHLFINFVPQGYNLDHEPPETPIGKIEPSGYETLDKLEDNKRKSKYPEVIDGLQAAMIKDGNKAADAYPLMDRIKHCKLIGTDKPKPVYKSEQNRDAKKKEKQDKKAEKKAKKVITDKAIKDAGFEL